MTMQTMGGLIASLRKERGMTQKDLAEKMNVTDKAVSKWERNLSCPDVNSIPRLAETLGVSVEELMNAAPKETEEKKEDDLVDLILRVVPFALGVAVTVLGIMDEMDAGSTLTGIGLLCVSIYQMRQNRK